MTRTNREMVQIFFAAFLGIIEIYYVTTCPLLSDCLSSIWRNHNVLLTSGIIHQLCVAEERYSNLEVAMGPVSARTEPNRTVKP